jgi:hypothetical protein
MAREASCSRKLCGVCAADLTDALIGRASKGSPSAHSWLGYCVDSVSNPPCSRIQPLWWVFFGAVLWNPRHLAGDDRACSPSYLDGLIVKEVYRDLIEG